MVRLLISSGADINARSETGKTALHFAAAIGATEIARLLITDGADTSIKDIYGDTAASLGTRNRQTATVALINAKVRRTSP
jgi:ankyrin repeat protein